MTEESPDKHALLSDDALVLIAEKLSAMGEPLRLKLLNLLCCEGELNVTELVFKSGGQQANISRHLAKLHSAGLVKRRKKGIQVYYSLADDSLPAICECLCRTTKNNLKKLSDYFLEQKPPQSKNLHPKS